MHSRPTKNTLRGTGLTLLVCGLVLAASPAARAGNSLYTARPLKDAQLMRFSGLLQGDLRVLEHNVRDGFPGERPIRVHDLRLQIRGAQYKLTIVAQGRDGGTSPEHATRITGMFLRDADLRPVFNYQAQLLEDQFWANGGSFSYYDQNTKERFTARKDYNSLSRGLLDKIRGLRHGIDGGTQVERAEARLEGLLVRLKAKAPRDTSLEWLDFMKISHDYD